MSTGLSKSHWLADTGADFWHVSCGDALRRAAALAGDLIALVEVTPPHMASVTGASTTDRRWTYAELLADAERCAGWLLARFKPGQHVCLWAPNVPEWVIVQFGAALAGVVLVTANPALREEELRHILQQSDAAGLIHVASYRGTDMAAIAAAVAEGVEVLVIDRFAETLAGTAQVHLPAVDPDAPAQMQFTSGTTGRPKGALLRHRALVTNAAFVAARSRQAGDVMVTPMPLFHTAGSVLSVLAAATTLSTLVLPLLFDPALMLDTIERERATMTSGVPTMLGMMIAEQLRTPRDLSTLRVITSGGAPVAPQLLMDVETVLGSSLISVYGQTELSPIVSATSVEDAVEDRAETAGRPLPHVELRIAASPDFEPVPVGQQGEIQARGYQTMIGYHGQPEATARTLLPDGWLRTGDLGSMDERGYLRITGRLSDMVIRGGENIYPAEVEAALLRLSAVAGVAVFGLPDEHWGEIVAAAIQVVDDQRCPDVDTLRSHCRQLLAPHKTPARWFAISSLPLTPSGKVMKYELRDAAIRNQLKILT